MKKVSVLQVKADCGASKSGAKLGSDSIVNVGLIQQLQNAGYSVMQQEVTQGDGNFISLPNLKNCSEVSRVNELVYLQTIRSIEQGYFPLTLGGDHSIAAGSVAAVSAVHKNIGVIWIDAHGDWNNEHSTESGNMHGMSFSAACGHGPDCMANFDERFQPVSPTKGVLIGARDLDREEKVRIHDAGITVITPKQVNDLGTQNAAMQALQVATQGTVGFHLSFDVDCISPNEAPGTGTIAEGGLTAEQALQIVNLLASSGKMLSMDVVEVNPLLDDPDDKTSKIAVKVAVQALTARLR